MKPGTIPASVKVLGARCARCRTLTTHTRAALDALGIDAPVEVVDDPVGTRFTPSPSCWKRSGCKPGFLAISSLNALRSRAPSIIRSRLGTA